MVLLVIISFSKKWFSTLSVRLDELAQIRSVGSYAVIRSTILVLMKV